MISCNWGPLIPFRWFPSILITTVNRNLSFLKVIFVADSLRLDLLRLGRSGNPLVSVIGDLDWICSDIGVASPLPYTADLVSSSEILFLPVAKPRGSITMQSQEHSYYIIEVTDLKIGLISEAVGTWHTWHWADLLRGLTSFLGILILGENDTPALGIHGLKATLGPPLAACG